MNLEELKNLDPRAEPIANSMILCMRGSCVKIAKYKIGYRYVCPECASNATPGYNKPLSELVNKPAP